MFEVVARPVQTIVEFVPPTCAPKVPEMENGPEYVRVVVATPYTPEVPFETRMFDEAGCEVVARPVYVMVEFVPPTSAPKVPEVMNGPETASDEVATFAKVFGPEKYGMLPTTAAVEVERPLQVKAPVALLYASGKTAESDEEEILLLKALQSADVRRPRLVADALGRLKVTVPPDAVTVKSVPVVLEAMRTVPVWV